MASPGFLHPALLDLTMAMVGIIAERIRPRHCLRCGRVEDARGCVRGMCSEGCDSARYCSICDKCEQHCACLSPDMRENWIEALNAKIRRSKA